MSCMRVVYPAAPGGAALPALEIVPIGLIVAADLVDAIAAELLQEGPGQHDGHHRLADDTRRRHGHHVAALHHRLHRFLVLDIHRAEGPAQRRDGLHGGSHDHRLAIGDAALETARAVGAPGEPARGIEKDLVVDLRSRAARRLEAHAHLGALDGMNGAEGLREPSVELAVPVHVGAQAHRTAKGHHLEHSAQGVALALGGVDGLDHEPLRLRIGAADLAGLRPARDLVPGLRERPDAHAADLGDVAQDGDAELAEEPPGHAGHRHPRGGLAGAGALQHVADVAVVVLHGPRQVGVAGAGAGHRLRGGARGLVAHRHGLLPVFPVAVLDGQRDRAPQGEPSAHAGGDVDLVALDLHPPAKAVAALAAREVPVDVGLGEREARGQPLDDGGQRLPVGFTRGEEAERRAHCCRYLGRTAIAPSDLTSDGVRKTTSSRPDSKVSRALKSQPSRGMSPKSGTFRTVFCCTDWVTPPITRRSPSLMSTWVSALRRLMMGTLTPAAGVMVSPRELFSTITTILIFVISSLFSFSRVTVGVTVSLSTASLNWIWVPAELTVA